MDYLSEVQLKELREVFDLVAKQHKALQLNESKDEDPTEEKKGSEENEIKVHRSQLVEAMHLMGILAREEDVLKQLNRSVPLQNKQHFSFEDFIQFMENFYEGNDTQVEIDHAFSAIRGYNCETEAITPDSLLTFFQSKGEQNLSIEECERIVQLVGDGTSISYDQFFEHMLMWPMRQ